MKALKKICDEQLISVTKTLVHEERQKTLAVIEHLQENYSRRLHLQRGFPSLHEFLVKELGYSDGAAHRRISAMRLVAEVPEAKGSISEGKLSLSTAAQVQQFFQSERKQKKIYAPKEKPELIYSVSGTSRRECERRLSRVSPTYEAKPQTLQIPGDEELRTLLEEYRQLAMLSDGRPQNLIKSALRWAIERMQSKEQGRQRARNDKASPAEPQTTTHVADAGATLTPPASPSRYRRKTTERTVWNRAQGACAYVDFKTGRRCGATHRLEYDHVEPFAFDGQSTTHNLQLLCRAHNQLRAVVPQCEYKAYRKLAPYHSNVRRMPSSRLT